MKLLIIGGSGQLSGRLAELAIAQGHEVWGVTRGNRPLPTGVHPLVADRGDDTALHNALASAHIRWDAAIDCICMNAVHARQDIALLGEFAGWLAVVSTDSVYHPAHKSVPQNEIASCYMADGGYGHHKRQMEQTFEQEGNAIAWTIFRPGHIFGPGCKLGCFPEHSRQDGLLAHIRADKPLRLVGGGQYLIHPIYVDDLALALLDCLPNARTHREIYCIGGSDAVPNAHYYTLLGELTGHPVTIEAIPEEGYLAVHPEYSGHLCQRSYDLSKLRDAGVRMPNTTLREGLLRQVEWLDKI